MRLCIYNVYPQIYVDEKHDDFLVKLVDTVGQDEKKIAP